MCRYACFHCGGKHAAFGESGKNFSACNEGLTAASRVSNCTTTVAQPGVPPRFAAWKLLASALQDRYSCHNGRAGDASIAESFSAASSGATTPAKSAHSPSTVARTAQPAAAGNGNQSSIGRTRNRSRFPFYYRVGGE